MSETLAHQPVQPWQCGVLPWTVSNKSDAAPTVAAADLAAPTLSDFITHPHDTFRVLLMLDSSLNQLLFSPPLWTTWQ